MPRSKTKSKAKASAAEAPTEEAPTEEAPVTKKVLESLEALYALEAQEEQEMDSALKAELKQLETRLKQEPPNEEVYLVNEGPLVRKIFILRIHGRFQTFVTSSGRSNKGARSYPGLCYPITHITTKMDEAGVRRRWYGKQQELCLILGSRLGEYEFRGIGDLKSRYETDDLCLKPAIRLFKWQYFLFRDFVRHYDPNAWDWLLNWPVISRQPPEISNQIKRVVYKLFHSIHYFREMSGQYFATEEQIVCSAALSLDDSPWSRPELIDLREFIRQRQPDLFAYYRALRDREGIIVSDSFLRKRMEVRNAILLRRTGIDYSRMLTERDPDPILPDESNEQLLVSQMTNSKHTFQRFEPNGETLVEQEPIFSPKLPPYKPRYVEPPKLFRDAKDDSLQPDPPARRSRSRSRERLGGSRRYTRKVHPAYPKRNNVRGRTVGQTNLFRIRTRKG
jgi:hypothetical protein